MPTSVPKSDVADLMLLLTQAGHALDRELTAALTDVGITPRHHCVLSKAMAGELTQTELAERCDLDKTTMVVTVDELERQGWATRRPSTADRRARIITVTDEGRRIVGKAQEIVDGIFDDVLSTLPTRERDALVGGLGRLVAGRLAERVDCERPPRRSRNR